MSIKRLRLYQPNEFQLAMHSSKKRYRIASVGRQAGKSTFAANELLKSAWETPNTKHWFVSPAYPQARDHFDRVNNSLMTCPEVIVRNNKSTFLFELCNGSTIEYKSGEVGNRLRGPALHSIIMDEVRDQPKDLYNLVLRPMITTTKGRASFVSSPNGFDAFFEMYCYAKEHPEDWDCFAFPSTANPMFTQQEYEAARASMSEKQFRQEILAEFLDLLAGKVYWAFDHRNISRTPIWSHDEETGINPHLPIVLGLDFNLDPMAWLLLQTNGQRWHIFKEVCLAQSNSQEASAVMCDLLETYRGKGLLRRDPQLRICGDAAGKARQRAAAGASDYDLLLGMLREKGFTFTNETPESNPLVRDRVNAVNAKCRSANGETNLTVDPINCPKLVRDMQMVVWKEGTGHIDKNKDLTLTHCSDAIGYPIHALTPIKEVNEVGELTVIQW